MYGVTRITCGQVHLVILKSGKVLQSLELERKLNGELSNSDSLATSAAIRRGSCEWRTTPAASPNISCGPSRLIAIDLDQDRDWAIVLTGIPENNYAKIGQDWRDSLVNRLPLCATLVRQRRGPLLCRAGQ
jgi:hypothetical protein